MQFSVFNDILVTLQDLINLTQALVVIVFIQLIINIAIAKNTQPIRKIEGPKERWWWRITRRGKKKKLESKRKELIS